MFAITFKGAFKGKNYPLLQVIHYWQTLTISEQLKTLEGVLH